jgi:crotonobetaine/carnitine-CoA ligase
VSTRADSFDALLADPASPVAVDAAAPVSVLFTSGTTARPKGVVWTNANVLWGAKLGAMQEGLREDDVHLVFLPLFHVVALTWSILPTMWVGGSAVLQPRFSATRFWTAALEHRCTWASMVPFCTAVLARQPVPESHAFRMWGHAVYSPDYEALFRVKLLGWWGMTEIVTQGVVGDAALVQTTGTIGRPSVGYDVAVVDDAGRPVSRCEAGELRIRGERGVSLFLEYFGDTDATAQAFDEHGYFRTGDRVLVRDDGTIQFVDRLKDVIKVGGENVAAPEVERVIVAVEGVREAAVVAMRDSVLGEVPVAFVLPDDSRRGSVELADEVLGACRRALAKFKVPREVVLVDDFPRVAIGKIAKAELRKRLSSR